MSHHDPTAPDYTLLEWILAIVVYDRDPNAHRVFPLLLGKVIDEETGIRSALDQKVLQEFPGNIY